MVLTNEDGGDDFDVKFAHGLSLVHVCKEIISDRVTNTADDLALSIAIARPLDFASFNTLSFSKSQ